MVDSPCDNVDALEELLHAQLDALRTENFPLVEELNERINSTAVQLGKTAALDKPENAEKIRALYRKLELSLLAEKKEIENRRAKISEGRKAIGKYKNVI